jgi:hypothetical protein
MATIPSLAQIAQKYETSAKAAAPYKDGTMRRSINVVYKTLDKAGSFEWSFKGVSYLKWWNDPPKVVKRKKLAARREFNFLNKPQNFKEARKMMDEYIMGEVSKLIAKELAGPLN